MVKAQDLTPAIQWHEGMLLAPQHFQLSSQRVEQLISYHAQLGGLPHWGVVSMAIDASLLLRGSFRLVELEAILPDGLVVDHRADPRNELTLDLTQYVDRARDESLEISIAVPIATSGARGEGDPSRYGAAVGTPVPDANTGEGAIDVPRLRPRLRLIAGSVPSIYAHLPIARVRYESGAFVLEDYHPPQLRVRSDSAIGRQCAALATALREKAAYLLTTIQSAASAEVSLLVENRRQIGHLVAALPQFEAVVQGDNAHPFTLHLALCALSGQLAALAAAEHSIPPPFPAYAHNDCKIGFDALFGYIEAALNEGLPDRFMPVAMRLENGVFHTGFLKEWAHRNLVIGVRGRPGMSERQVMDWVAGALIGTESWRKSMRSTRILGAYRQRVERVEGLMSRRGMLLFALSVDPEFIVAGERLELFNASQQSSMLPIEAYLFVAKN